MCLKIHSSAFCWSSSGALVVCVGEMSQKKQACDTPDTQRGECLCCAEPRCLLQSPLQSAPTPGAYFKIAGLTAGSLGSWATAPLCFSFLYSTVHHSANHAKYCSLGKNAGPTRTGSFVGVSGVEKNHWYNHWYMLGANEDCWVQTRKGGREGWGGKESRLKEHAGYTSQM